MGIETYVPEEHGATGHGGRRYFKVLVEVHPCCSCGRSTVAKLGGHQDGPFPRYYLANFEAQVQRAGILLVASYKDAFPVCSACHDSGAVTGICALCKEERKLSEMKESIGATAEHMCKACYATVPAKEWAERLQEIEERHRYDWE